VIRQISYILLLALLFDIAYGMLSLNTPFGCSTVPFITVRTTVMQDTLNWKILFDPCFYIYYFGILDGSALIMTLIPVPRKEIVALD